MTPSSSNTPSLSAWPRIVVGSALLAALALAGCNRNEPETVGERVDSAIGKAADKMDAAGARIEEGVEQAQASIERATDSAAQALSDTGLTAAIKARLAADDDLKVLQISVETQAGRATLKGTAPDAAARDRATQLAGAVEGVVSVDNQLMLKN